MAFTVIPNSIIDADSPLDTTLFTYLRDNDDALKALFNISTGHDHGGGADDGATVIVNGSSVITLFDPASGHNHGGGANSGGPVTVADNSITTIKIVNSAVTEAKMAGSAISQSKLKIASGEVSTGGAANLTLPGGTYGFYPVIRTDGSTTANIQIASTFTNTSNICNIYINSTGGTSYAQQTYIQASPPYKLGDVEWQHFLYILWNPITKQIVASYEAEDPPWAYNGSPSLGKDQPDKIKEVPHPFTDYHNNILPANLEICLVDLNSFDVAGWKSANGGRILQDLSGKVEPKNEITKASLNIPNIVGFSNIVKIRKRI